MGPKNIEEKNHGAYLTSPGKDSKLRENKTALHPKTIKQNRKKKEQHGGTVKKMNVYCSSTRFVPCSMAVPVILHPKTRNQLTKL